MAEPCTQLYADFLARQTKEGPAGKNKAYASLSKGWALASEDFKRALLKDHAAAMEVKAWASEGAQAARETRWSAALKEALAKLPVEKRASAQKSAPWKVAVATRTKDTTDLANGWLAEQLDMGPLTTVIAVRPGSASVVDGWAVVSM